MVEGLSSALEEAADGAVGRQWFNKFDGAYEGYAYALWLDSLNRGADVAREFFELTGAIFD